MYVRTCPAMFLFTQFHDFLKSNWRSEFGQAGQAEKGKWSEKASAFVSSFFSLQFQTRVRKRCLNKNCFLDCDFCSHGEILFLFFFSVFRSDCFLREFPQLFYCPF